MTERRVVIVDASAIERADRRAVVDQLVRWQEARVAASAYRAIAAATGLSWTQIFDIANRRVPA